MMRKQTEGAISIGFADITKGTQTGREPVGYATLDIGPVSYGLGAKSPRTQVRRLADRLVVTTEFGLSIADNSLHTASAMLRTTVTVGAEGPASASPHDSRSPHIWRPASTGQGRGS